MELISKVLTAGGWFDNVTICYGWVKTKTECTATGYRLKPTEVKCMIGCLRSVAYSSLIKKITMQLQKLLDYLKETHVPSDVVDSLS